MVAEQADRLLLGLAEQAGDLGVDGRLGGLGERAAGHAGAAGAEEHRAALGVADRTDRRRQPELADHLDGEVGRGGQVVGRAGRALAELDQFGGPAAEPHGQGLGEVVLAVQVPLDQGQLLGHAERLPGGQDGDLGHRIGARRQRGDHGVARLVHGHGLLLLREQHVGALPAAEDDPVPGGVEVGGGDHIPAVADRVDGCLVDQVGQVGSGEARRAAGHHVEVHARIQLLAAAVNPENGLPLGEVGQGDGDLAVESAGAEQCRVEDLGPVRGGEHHDALGRVEAVHLGQQLVERLLPLVVSDDRTGAGPPLADRVQFVDEDDDRRPLARLGEQVTDPRGADADEQLHEAGACHGEERHVRLAGHRPGDERLTGARRADHEHPARRGRPGAAVPVGVPQEVHHLDDLRLGALVPGDVAEPRLRPFRVEHLRPGTANPEHALQLPGGAATGQPHPQPAEQQERREQQHPREHLGAERGTRSAGGDLHVRLLQLVEQGLAGLARDDRVVRAAVLQRPAGLSG